MLNEYNLISIASCQFDNFTLNVTCLEQSQKLKKITKVSTHCHARYDTKLFMAGLTTYDDFIRHNTFLQASQGSCDRYRGFHYSLSGSKFFHEEIPNK